MGLYGPYTNGDNWVRLSIGFASETNTRVDLVDAAPRVVALVPKCLWEAKTIPRQNYKLWHRVCCYRK